LQLARATRINFRNRVHSLFHGFHAEIDRAFVEKRLEECMPGGIGIRRVVFSAQLAQ
jgi:hypothetical protein